MAGEVGWAKDAMGCLSWVGAFVIVILVLLKILFFDMALVAHSAMAPTLLRDERVLIYKSGTPELGRIAVCQHPSEDGLVFGRVVARGKMSIESFGNELKLDKQPASVQASGALEFHNPDTDAVQRVHWGTEDFAGRPHSVFYDPEGSFRVRHVELEPGQLYLLGDNRPYRGQDSRTFGPVGEASCVGTIVLRLTASDGLRGDLRHSPLQEVL